jgi:MFS family permease
MVGWLLDRFGARTLLILVGVLFGGAALWMSKVSSPLDLYFGFAALRTLGQGSLTLVPTTLVSLWFIRLRGRVISIVSVGMMTSAAVFPILLHNLIGALGWRETWVVLTFSIWVLVTIPSIFFVRRTPESVGLLPDGGEIRSVENKANSEPIDNWSFGEALRTRSLWLLMFAATPQSLITTALTFHHVSVMASRGVGAGTAAVVLSVLAISALISTVVTGFLSDRYPNRFIIAAGQVLLGIAMFLVINVSATWQAFSYGIFLGLAGGLTLTISGVVWPNYYGRKELGRIRGLATTASVAAAALGPLSFGYIFDLTGSYTPVVLALLTLPATCLVAALFAIPPGKKR